jgi:site-specific recombinase XerD
MPDGKTLYVHVFMEKTQKPLNVPLSSEALKVLEENVNPDEPIFKLPSSDATINYHIKKWVKKGHVDKKISFHCSRHTFATMMITLGADLYTTSKLLGHANVATTQIYSKIIDKKKVEAVNLVDSLFAPTQEESINQEGYED